MGADHEVRLKSQEGLDEGEGVEFFKRLGDSLPPGLVGSLVNHAQEPGGTVDQIEIDFGIDGAENGGSVFEDVPVLHIAAGALHGGMLLEILHEGLGGAARGRRLRRRKGGAPVSPVMSCGDY